MMNSLNFPINTHTDLVADASVIINLNATGRAFDIIRAIPGSVSVTENALSELSAGACNGHCDDKKLQNLIDSGVVKLVKLGEAGTLIYASLVEGATRQTLDDGEAATIGYARETGAIAIIDERKARTICANEFPGLAVMSTIDLLAHDLVESALGKKCQTEAILNALREARMRVPLHQIEMVINLIGEEAAATCTSLPRVARVAGERPIRP